MTGLRLLRWLLAVSVLVSIVHYADNVANYADYPVPTSGPVPSRDLIAGSWFAFTAFGIAALWLFQRGEIGWAVVCLVLYSFSGLVGFGHYTVPGATAMPWWRQLHVVVDIACGLAVLGFAAWALSSSRRAPRRSTAPGPRGRR